MNPRLTARRRLAAATLAVLALGASWTTSAAPALDPEVRTRAEAAVQKGLAFLKTRQMDDGAWSRSVGITGLVARGFLEAPGHADPANAPFVGKGLKFILSKTNADGSISEGKVNAGYNTAIAIMALADTGDAAHKATIAKGAQYLKKIQIDEGEGFHSKQPWYGGIGYSDDERPDMSNQFFALQALKAAATDPKDPVWDKAMKFINRSQNRSESNDQTWAGNDGGFVYMPGMNLDPFKGTESYGTMTSAGLISLLYAGADKKDPRVADAYKWIRLHYTLETVPGSNTKAGLYYFYYAFAQCMAAYGSTTVVDGKGQTHNWRNDLANKLISLQLADGSWINKDSAMWWQDNPDLVTAWSLNALNQLLK